MSAYLKIGLFFFASCASSFAYDFAAGQAASPYQGNAVAHGPRFPSSMSNILHSYITSQVGTAIAARANWINQQTEMDFDPSNPTSGGIYSLVTQQRIPPHIQKALHKLITTAPSTEDEAFAASQKLLLNDLVSGPEGEKLRPELSKLLKLTKGLTLNNKVKPDHLLNAWKAYNNVVEKASLAYMSRSPWSFQALQFLYTIFTR